jgi:Tol biopolymer transport system component
MTVRMLVVAALTFAVSLVAALSVQAAFHLTLVSVNSHGDPADGNSESEANGGSISADGRLAAFEATADNLPGGDGVISHCYVRNLRTGKTLLVSVKSNGQPASGDTADPKISANGRFVTFFGDGDGLPGSGGPDQVWVHDLKTKKTILASRNSQGDPGDDSSAYPSLSGNGRFVAFEGYSSNFPGDDESDSLTYVRDLERGKLLLGSRTSDGDPAEGYPYGQALSSDGRLVIFQSADPVLPHGGGTRHIYARNLETGKVALVDKTSNGTIANGQSTNPAIAGSGRFITFASDATNFPGNGSTRQAYMRDLRREKTVLVSQTTAGDPQDGTGDYPHASADGRYVAFSATGANLPGGNGSTFQIYVRDVREGNTRLISKTAEGDPGTGHSRYPSISADGDWVLIDSDPGNLGGDPSFNNVFRAGPVG